MHADWLFVWPRPFCSAFTVLCLAVCGLASVWPAFSSFNFKNLHSCLQLLNLVFFLFVMAAPDLHEVPNDDDGPVFHVDGTRRYRWDHFLGSAARQISGPGAAPRRELTQLVFRTPNPDVVGTVYSLYLCCIVDPVGFLWNSVSTCVAYFQWPISCRLPHWKIFWTISMLIFLSPFVLSGTLVSLGVHGIVSSVWPWFVWCPQLLGPFFGLAGLSSVA